MGNRDICMSDEPPRVGPASIYSRTYVAPPGLRRLDSLSVLACYIYFPGVNANTQPGATEFSREPTHVAHSESEDLLNRLCRLFVTFCN